MSRAALIYLSPTPNSPFRDKRPKAGEYEFGSGGAGEGFNRGGCAGANSLGWSGTGKYSLFRSRSGVGLGWFVETQRGWFVELAAPSPFVEFVAPGASTKEKP